MNIIEAWKLAKDGQRIKRNNSNVGNQGNISIIKYAGASDGISHVLLDALVKDGSPGRRMFDCHVLADDWEIVKEHKKIKTTWHSLTTHKLQCYPHDAKVTIEWDE